MQGKLTVERVRTKGGWPKLKAKAAATRHLSTFALYLATTYDDGSDHDRRMIAVCQLLDRFYQIIDKEGQLLSDAAKAEMSELGTNLCVLYAQLSSDALRQGAKRWTFSPTHHLFQHLCEWQGPENSNPGFTWIYLDEDLVGKLIKVAHSCHPSTMPETALFKWSLCFFSDV